MVSGGNAVIERGRGQRTWGLINHGEEFRFSFLVGWEDTGGLQQREDTIWWSLWGHRRKYGDPEGGWGSYPGKGWWSLDSGRSSAAGVCEQIEEMLWVIQTRYKPTKFNHFPAHLLLLLLKGQVLPSTQNAGSPLKFLLLLHFWHPIGHLSLQTAWKESLYNASSSLQPCFIMSRSDYYSDFHTDLSASDFSRCFDWFCTMREIFPKWKSEDAIPFLKSIQWLPSL